MPLPHETPDEFLAALQLTTGRSGFRAELIEKDYYCSVVLQLLFAGGGSPLCFKGGTALNKVHAGFYRLSEDLDFTLHGIGLSTRAGRSRAAEPFKRRFSRNAQLAPGLRVSEPLTGHNESKQYIAEICYPSLVTGRTGSIQIDIGLRERLMDAPVAGPVQTLLINPLTGSAAMPAFPVSCLSLVETYAEKLRAALARPEPAIRDLYDLWHARRQGLVEVTEELLAKVHGKLEATEDPWVPLAGDRRRQFEQQLATELEPVLRPADFAEFRVEEAYAIVADLEKRLGLQ